MLKKTGAIGIFDSGSGGLTVTKALVETLPFEDIIYFGDTAHAPWGDKSTAAIQHYALKITEVLLAQECKLILVACHTASAVALDIVQECVGQRALVVNVIDPVISTIFQQHSHKKIGLIGTKQTVHSNIYRKKLDAIQANIKFTALATPLLVPLIEEGFAEKKFTQAILAEYLANPSLEGIKALILGCTHYPLLKEAIEAYYQGRVEILDASKIVAKSIKTLLTERSLLNTQSIAKKTFYLSDYNEFFHQTAKLFFSDDIHLDPYPLWDQN